MFAPWRSQNPLRLEGFDYWQLNRYGSIINTRGGRLLFALYDITHRALVR